MSFKSCFRLFSLLGAAVAAYSDSPTVKLSGEVTDPSGAEVPNATIRLDNRDSGSSFSGVTDQHGAYSVVVPRGDYLLRVDAAGLTLPESPRTVSLTAPDAQLPQLQLHFAPTANTVVVTATGTPQSLDETAKAVDVISRDELMRRGTETLVDGLRQLPGLRVSQRGGPGSLATVQIRGLRTFDTSILLDGMRFRDVGATQGDAQSYLGDLLSIDAGRLEVLRGSGSSLYGTNATGGAINIVTDSGTGPFHGDITADGGGLGEFRGVAHFGASALGNRLNYSAGVGHLNVTRGVDNDDDYRNTTGNGRIDYSLRPGLVLRGRVLAADGFVRLNQTPSAAPSSALPRTGNIPAIGLSPQQSQLASQGLPYSLNGATFIPSLDDPDYFRTSRFASTMVAIDHQISAPLSYRISFQDLLSNRDVINGPLGPGFQSPFRTSSEYNGRVDTLQGRVNLLAGSHQLLTAGYEFERESLSTPATDGNPNPVLAINSNTHVSETSSSFDVQDQIRLFQDRFQISLSGRVQLFTLSQPTFTGTVPAYANASAISPPNAYTGDISLAYFFKTSRTKIRSHAGNGYRVPSLYERFGTYFDGASFTAYGDPRLRPERSIGIDGGIDQYFASEKLKLSASYFYTRLQEVIGFDFSGIITPGTDPFRRSQGYRNTSGGLARGVEFSAEAKPWRSTQVRSSYTYTNSRDRFSQFGNGTLQTPRILPHTFSVVVLQQFGPHVDAALDFVAGSDYLFPFSGRTFVFAGPRQAGLSVGYTHPLGETSRVRLYTTIKNLANQTYYEDGFTTPGRWAVAGVTYSF
ncbi:MAG: TonB-dependent receptor domain-containing protein [Bryobacteraceae bacterium]